MMANFFDQFASPSYLGIPLFMIAIIVPSLLFPTPPPRWLNNRFTTTQVWLVNQFAKQLMLPLNEKAHKWALLLTSVFMYLITMNLLGLLPYTFTPTTQLALNLGFAVPLWFATVLVGMRNQPTISLAHLLPEGTPIPLIPVLIIIETISLIIRPFALAVRLTANLTAGHLLIRLIAAAVVALSKVSTALAILTAIVLSLLTILEFAVAMIQAYVFVLLLSLYLQENV
uniref:ATP synthase subunit a n=1 Tax=Clypeobarbus pleuropholis TaxID=643461 RepID=A0A1E1FMQ8_9TELE|nr:ATP synthase F0 subunit 6 [Clypeobarbus pleuropholis]BAV71788.1 ATPase subunit 6 [Clypeobarbus pleuropholis]